MATTVFIIFVTVFVAPNMVQSQHSKDFLFSPKGEYILLGRSSCSTYYKSYTNYRWNDARDACGSLESNATLLSVETKDELERIKQMLDDDFDGSSSFWVDGKWEGGCYKWATPNTCVDESTVVIWSDGIRPMGNIGMHLQLVYQGPNDNITFRDAKIENRAKSLCEVPMRGQHCNRSF